MPLANTLEFLCLGFLVGALGTLIGAGGGFILVPTLLIFLPDHSASTITAVSLTVVFFNAYAGSWAYARTGRIDYAAGLRFAAAGIPGALLGTWMVQFIPRRPFNLGFGLVLFSLGIYLIACPTQRAAKVIHPSTETRAGKLRSLIGTIGSAYLGLLSSLLGIGGGILHVPFLIRVLKYEPHIATATSHFVLAIVAFVGAACHLFRGELNELMAPTALIALGVMSGAPLGAAVSHKVRGPLLVRLLACCLCAVALRLLF